MVPTMGHSSAYSADAVSFGYAIKVIMGYKATFISVPLGRPVHVCIWMRVDFGAFGAKGLALVSTYGAWDSNSRPSGAIRANPCSCDS